MLAELLDVPVMTTMAGKSAFPENHPLSLGAGGRTVSGMVKHFLSNADLVFGLGCSFSIEFSTLIPRGKVMIQNSIDESDINKHYTIDYAIIGDCKLVLRQLVDAVKQQLGPHGRRDRTNMAQEIRTVKHNWLAEWMPKLTSEEIPINPYRVIWDMMHVVDRTNTVVTHDSGNPRDQLVPFYEAIAPGGYIGWGKSTQLGYGLGLIMGAKLAAPEKLCVNVMGDASIGMTGMDIETAARNRIAILTVVFNNGVMAAERDVLELSTKKYGALTIGGNYTKVAEGLNVAAMRIEKPGDIVPAIKDAVRVTETGAPFLLEILVKEGYDFSRYPLAGL